MNAKEEKLNIILLKKVTNNPSEPIFSNGVYSFKAEFAAQEASVDGCPLYVYHAGYKINIPDGYIGLLTAADTVASSSLIAATDVRILKPGMEHDLFLAFKLTTNASPAMFKTHTYGQEATMDTEAIAEEEGSVFCNLVLLADNSADIIYTDEDGLIYAKDQISVDTTGFANGAGAQEEVTMELHEIDPTTDPIKVTLSEDIVENVEAPSIEEVLTTGYSEVEGTEVLEGELTISE